MFSIVFDSATWLTFPFQTSRPPSLTVSLALSNAGPMSITIDLSQSGRVFLFKGKLYAQEEICLYYIISYYNHLGEIKR